MVRTRYNGTTYTIKNKLGEVVWTDTILNGVGSAEDVTIELTEDTTFTIEVNVTNK